MKMTKARWYVYGVPRCWAQLAELRICSRLIWPWQESVWLQGDDNRLVHKRCATTQCQLRDEQATARLRAAA